MKLRERPDDVVALAQHVHDATGIPVAHVVKDFWITELLRGLTGAAREMGVPLVFKGGTSLSKAYGLLRRFSEDVDVLVVLDGTTNERERDLKALVGAAVIATGLIGSTVAAGTSRGVRRAVRVDYPAVVGSGGLAHGVLLELGTRGGLLPFETCAIRSLIAQYRPVDVEGYQEAAPVDVDVLGPERTLVEKLVLLHTAHSTTPSDPRRHAEHVMVVRRAARHFYDIHQLLRSQRVTAALPGGVAVWARDVVAYSTLAGRPVSPRPRDGFAASPAFDGSGAFLPDARDECDRRVASDLVWPGRPVPSFDACIAAVQECAGLL